MARRPAKVKYLMDLVDEELPRLERLERVLRTNIVPPVGTQSDTFRTQALDLLRMSRSALEEAGTYIKDIK